MEILEPNYDDACTSNQMTDVILHLLKISKKTSADVTPNQMKIFAQNSYTSSNVLQSSLENTRVTNNKILQNILSKNSTNSVIKMLDEKKISNEQVFHENNDKKYYPFLNYYKQSNNLKHHIQMSAYEKPYRCHKCFCIFALKRSLRGHLFSHIQGNNFCCKDCGKRFPTSNSLKIHMLFHSRTKPSVCNVFNDTPSGTNNRPQSQKHKSRNSKLLEKCLKDNINLVNAPFQTPKVVTISGAKVSKSGAINKFIETSSYSGQSSICSSFENSLKKSSQCNKPVHSPTAENLFQCPQCDKKFVSNRSLKNHLRVHVSVKSYKCKTCETSFTSNKLLKNHLRVHVSVKPYKCIACETSFTSNRLLINHVCLDTGPPVIGPYLCPYCEKAFKMPTDCKQHIATHLQELSLNDASHSEQCDTTYIQEKESENILSHTNQNFDPGCVVENRKSFENAFEINSSLQSDLSSEVQFLPKIQSIQSLEEFDPEIEYVPPFEGDLQIKSILSIEELTSDNQSVLSFKELVPDKQQSSEACDTIQYMPRFLNQDIFNTKTGEIEEARIIYNDQDFKNNQRTVVSTSEAVSANDHQFQDNIFHSAPNESFRPIFTKHQETRDKKNLSCPVCFSCFATKRIMKNHMKSHTGCHKCDTCGQMFDDADTLKHHKQQHLLEELDQKFKCPHCPYFSNQQNCYQNHLLTHNGQLYECNKCYKTFAVESNLMRHLKSHLREKPFKCSICHKGFTRKFDCQKHERGVHSKQRVLKQCAKYAYPRHLQTIPNQKLQCPYCLFSSNEAILFQNHALTHIGELPYECQECHKFFASDFKLKRHLKAYHGFKPFNCSVCQKAFARKYDCKKHERVVHAPQKEIDQKLKCPNCSFWGSDLESLQDHQLTHIVGSRYKCNECPQTFTRKHSLKSHFTIHSGEKPFVCSICCRAFRRKDDCEKHEKFHHSKQYILKTPKKIPFTKYPPPYHDPDVKFKCPFCPFFSDKSKHLKNHVYTHIAGPPYNCYDCQKTFSSKYSLKSHLSIHTGWKPYACSICSKSFRRKDDCQMHEKFCHSKNNKKNPLMKYTENERDQELKCPHCPSLSSDFKSFHNHLVTHMGPPYKCSECHKKFANKRSLIGHLSIHTGEKPYSCSHCSREFRRNDDCKKHEFVCNSRHDETDQLFQCPGCLFSTDEFDCLQDHLVAHTQEEPYKCNECHETFSLEQTLMKHLEIHFGENTTDNTNCLQDQLLSRTEELLHKCNKCLRTFSSAPILKLHLKTHSSDKPYTCSLCSKTFVLKDDCQRHENFIHKIVKEYACSFCERSFSDKGEKTTHESMHTGEMPYECPSCDKKFRSASSRNRHVICNHTGVYPYHCPLCKKGFISTSDVNRHLQSKYNTCRPEST